MLKFLLFFTYLILSIFIFKKKKKKINFYNIKKKTFLKWVQLILLEVKSDFRRFTFKILRVFLIVFRINYLGLIILIPQVFLNNLSVSLIFLAFSIWILTYIPTFYYNKNKISMSIIGDLMSPSLSLLLSNIEVLTHLFRPITLTARLWVNIWVGHLIIRVLSFVLVFRLKKTSTILLLTSTLILIRGFFIFESLIIFLQTFVFRFLLKVFFEENEMNSILIKKIK